MHARSLFGDFGRVEAGNAHCPGSAFGNSLARATNRVDFLTASRSATLGDELFVAGRLDEAMAAYRQALALSPGFAAARVGLDAILERARTRQPNEQLIQLLIDAYADNGANWLISIAPDRRIQGLESLSRVKGSDFEVIEPSPPPRQP